jgi:hypothetical protein
MSFVKSFRLATLAFVVLQASPARADAPTVIDWSKGPVQDTAASCGTVAMKRLADRHSYSLFVRGTVAGTCVFEAGGLTFHLPSNYGSTTQGRTTLFHFLRFGSDVIVTWMPGY